MSYDTEEQQIEKLKEWWKENGTSLIIGAVLGLGAFFGWRYWQETDVADQKAASDLYNKVVEMVEAKDEEKIAESVKAVKENYSDSSYAILSAFQLAKLAVEKSEFDKAADELNWIIKNHPTNELTNLAKIRLARILIEQAKPKDALALVNQDEKSGYYALASLVKGDALLALEREDEALEAYKVASVNRDITGRHSSLNYKIEKLTSTQAVPANQQEQLSEEKKVEEASQTDEKSASEESK